jgi:SAM-dependent methyltransferase
MTSDASPPAFGQRLPVVDLRCGDGRQTRFLARHFHTVIGLDVFAAAIERAKAAAHPANVKAAAHPASVTYRVVDARDPDAASALRDRIGDANVYIRGVLHARPPDARRLAVETLARLLGNVDVVHQRTVSRSTLLLRIHHRRYGPPTGLTRVMQFAGPPGEISESEVARLFPPHHFQVLRTGAPYIGTVKASLRREDRDTGALPLGQGGAHERSGCQTRSCRCQADASVLRHRQRRREPMLARGLAS